MRVYGRGYCASSGKKDTTLAENPDTKNLHLIGPEGHKGMDISLTTNGILGVRRGLAERS
jgi:hypothetical protein